MPKCHGLIVTLIVDSQKLQIDWPLVADFLDQLTICGSICRN